MLALELPKYAHYWEMGMRVTTKEPVHAYYSGYHRPIQMFNPGMVGVIGAVMVPFVTGAYRSHTKHPYFVCVDFIGDNGEKWRAGVDYEDLVEVKDEVKWRYHSDIDIRAFYRKRHDIIRIFDELKLAGREDSAYITAFVQDTAGCWWFSRCHLTYHPILFTRIEDTHVET